MRATVTVIVLAAAAAGSFGGLGCRVEAHTQTQFIGSENSKTASADYNGEEVTVNNSNGDVIVEQDSSVTKVTVTMRPVAFADDDQKPDAQEAWTDVLNTFAVNESGGTVAVSCGKASGSHGTAGTSGTGCKDLHVKIPAGKGIKLSVTAHNGSLDAKNLTAADGATINLVAQNGSLNAVITGGAKISGENGDVTVSSTPTKGSTLDISTGNGDIDLALPSSFAADTIAFSAGEKVTIDGFSDITKDSTSRGTKGEGYASLSAKASSLGELHVKSR
jgi:hypothetical protein